MVMVITLVIRYLLKSLSADHFFEIQGHLYKSIGIAIDIVITLLKNPIAKKDAET